MECNITYSSTFPAQRLSCRTDNIIHIISQFLVVQQPWSNWMLSNSWLPRILQTNALQTNNKIFVKMQYIGTICCKWYSIYLGKNVCWLKNYHIKIYKYDLNTHKLENIIRGSHHQVQLVNQLNLHNTVIYTNILRNEFETITIYN